MATELEALSREFAATARGGIDWASRKHAA